MAKKSILERLEFWDLELQEGEDEHGRHWFIETGADYWRADEEDAPTRKQALAELTNEFDELILSKERLEKHLDWRGYHHGESGWSKYAKLDDIWKHLKRWEFITNEFEEAWDEGEELWHVQDMLASSDWDWWKDTLPPIFNPKFFKLGGRSGGWILYTVENLSVAEAEALIELYETVPPLLEDLQKRIASSLVGDVLADKWGMTFDFGESDAIYLSDKNRTVRLEIHEWTERP